MEKKIEDYVVGFFGIGFPIQCMENIRKRKNLFYNVPETDKETIESLFILCCSDVIKTTSELEFNNDIRYSIICTIQSIIINCCYNKQLITIVEKLLETSINKLENENEKYFILEDCDVF